MNDDQLEDAVRQMLRNRADAVTVPTRPLDEIGAAAGARRANPSRRLLAVAASVAVVAGAAGIAFGRSGDGPTTVVAERGGGRTETTAVTPTSASPDDPVTPVEACSAAAASVVLEPQPQLPPKVAAIRTKIGELAARCDFDGLEEMALSNGPDVGFTFTYGGAEQGPAGYWRDREAEGEPVLRRLLEVLSLRPVRQDPPAEVAPEDRAPPQWVWPAVSGTDRPSEQDWDDLRAFHSDEEIAEAREHAGAWYGYRVGITQDGDWIYFVAGD